MSEEVNNMNQPEKGLPEAELLEVELTEAELAKIAATVAEMLDMKAAEPEEGENELPEAEQTEMETVEAELPEVALTGEERTEAELTEEGLPEAVSVEAELSEVELTAEEPAEVELTEEELQELGLTEAELSELELTEAELQQTEQSETETIPAGKRFRLTTLQKCLAVICMVLTICILGVIGCRSLFVAPEIPTIDNKKPPVFTEPDGSGSSEEPLEEMDPDNDFVPKKDGERKSDKFYTILVLGRDTGGGGNTDTMLLASYDVTNQKATVMSIPRDTMVNVSWDGKKINTVYNSYGKGNKGLQAVYREISQLVGFEPDYEVVVEWEAVGAMVDAIGGVWFDVPYDMDYHDPYQDLVIEQKKGYRLLNGEDAMQVIRWRKNDPESPYGYRGGIGDSGRMKMQQNFLKAVITQLLKPENVARISDIAKVFEENVQTSLTFRNILWFGLQAVQGGLNADDVTFVTMPYSYADVYSRNLTERLGTYTTLAYVVPKAEELLKLVNESLNPFKEEFKLEDLDIMYVNPDGSIGSTTGQVADKEAALPPPTPPAKTENNAGGTT